MKNFTLLLVGIFLALSAKSQSIESYVITSAGAAIMDEGGAMYISIGEPMSTEITSGDIMISQGFLQISAIARIVSTDNLLQEPIQAFPNPSFASLTLEMPEMDGQYVYHLLDLNGRLLKNERITSSKEIIDLDKFESGTYLMKVIKENKSSQTLKIVKL